MVTLNGSALQSLSAVISCVYQPILSCQNFYTPTPVSVDRIHIFKIISISFALT